jgi:hypothetical protein
MKPGATGTGPVPGGEFAFTTTHWSVVVAAGQRDSPEAAEALETLCRTYWYPLYAYVRRCGYRPEDAQDLTQDFYAQLLAKDFVARADPLKGRFRSFLLAGLKHLLSHDREKARRLKRGGRPHHRLHRVAFAPPPRLPMHFSVRITRATSTGCASTPANSSMYCIPSSLSIARGAF